MGDNQGRVFELEELLHKRAKYAHGLRAEHDQARAWARAWKRAAKGNRFRMMAWVAMADELDKECHKRAAQNRAKDAEIKRLREVCEAALELTLLDEIPQPWMVQQLEQQCRAALKGADDESD